jgi:hypothetical protein
MLDLAVNWLPIFKSATDHRWLAEKPNIKVHHADPKSAKWEGSIPARDSSRGRNAVNLNKPYIPSLDSTSSTLLADRSRPTAFVVAWRSPRTRRKCGTGSSLPAFV